MAVNLQLEFPFILLGLIAGCWKFTPLQLRSRWLVTWLGAVVIIILAKVGQLLLPLHYFNWGEIIWGVIGTLEGMTTTALLIPFLRRVVTLLKKTS